ncbi:MAG: archaetidylserine decarboxylase [Opitutales bacterium]|nr:archaetidylserine decarboxylase [Opitutales bacterium]
MEEIHYLNRATGKVEKEDIYGESWLRFTYEKPLGKFFLWLLVKRKMFSAWYGYRASSASSKARIQPFIEKFKVNKKEFLDFPEDYKTFNQFFYRKLKPDARPIDDRKNSIVFPADGRHLGFQDISKVDGIYVKGQTFNLNSFLQSSQLAKVFQGGSLVISRLCPVDYHRFHFPATGEYKNTRLINGSLHSVSPIALKQNISFFWQNKRYLSILASKSLGQVAQVAVGATCVGSATFTSHDYKDVNKGDEWGYFSFGGSCIITLFERDKVSLSQDLLDASQNGLELYAKMGEIMGTDKKFV